MKLNGWIRIGIVLSCIWLLVVVSFAVLEYRAHVPANSTFVSWRVAKTGEDYSRVVETTGMFAELVPLKASLRFERFFGVLLFPLVGAWIVSYVVVYTVRWMMGGFRTEKT